MKRIIILCLILALLLACVPTPEEEPIAQRGEAKDAEEMTAEQFEVPAHVSLPAKGSGICSVTIDADVSMPENMELGISETTQRSFSDDEMTGMMRILSGADAPVQTFSASTDLVYFEDGQGGSFGVSLGEFVWFRDRTRYIIQLSGMDAAEKRAAKTPEISQEEAEKEVVSLLERLGLRGYGIDDAFTEPCAFMLLDTPDVWGWRFICVPTVGNAPCVYADGFNFSRNTSPSIGAPWEYEWIEIGVHKGGIAQFAWKHPAIYGEPQKSGSMVPFDTIVENAQQQLLYMNAVYDFDTDLKSDQTTTKITVDSIRLVRGTVQVKDRFDVGQNIPLWEISYTEQYRDQEPCRLSIYINAYDGTYVEPRMTYKEIMEIYGR